MFMQRVSETVAGGYCQQGDVDFVCDLEGIRTAQEAALRLGEIEEMSQGFRRAIRKIDAGLEEPNRVESWAARAVASRAHKVRQIHQLTRAQERCRRLERTLPNPVHDVAARRFMAVARERLRPEIYAALVREAGNAETLTPRQQPRADVRVSQ